MRVTAEVKAATRQRILEESQRLFATVGFEACTTRQIAEASEIATGTLFNYFATKEQILAALVAEALASSRHEFAADAASDLSFEEALFTDVARGLRKLKPFRKHLPALLATTLSPLAAAGSEETDSWRLCHLETVVQLARRHGLAEPGAVALQLYRTLYTGVLMFWARDRSAKQQDTLALLDDSLSMFVAWLQKEPDSPNHNPNGGASS
jgi:AcrR family transcriptional regulator